MFIILHFYSHVHWLSQDNPQVYIRHLQWIQVTVALFISNWWRFVQSNSPLPDYSNQFTCIFFNTRKPNISTSSIAASLFLHIPYCFWTDFYLKLQGAGGALCRSKFSLIIQRYWIPWNRALYFYPFTYFCLWFLTTCKNRSFQDIWSTCEDTELLFSLTNIRGCFLLSTGWHAVVRRIPVHLFLCRKIPTTTTISAARRVCTHQLPPAP